MSGISPTGFDLKRLEDTKLDLENLFSGKFGAIDKDPDSVMGQIIGVLAKANADMWEVAEQVYNSQYPSTAEGISLDGVADLTGVKRLSATKSLVTVQANGDQGTVLSAGRVFSVIETNEKFNSLSTVNIDRIATVSLLISVQTVQNNTLYQLIVNGNNIDFTSDANATATEIIAGLKTAVDGASEPVVAIDNGDDTLTLDTNDFTISYNGNVSANLQIDKVTSNVSCEADNFGPIIALSGTVTQIETPVAGLDTISNKFDATLGRNQETDVEFRLRRQQSLQIGGTSTVEAIKSSLLQVTGVTGVTVIENDTGVVDGGGRPGHSFEAVVSGGTDNDIATDIWLSKAAGIQTFGTETIPVTDSQGIVHNINFSRATETYLWVRITLTKAGEKPYPTDGDQQIIDGVVALGATHNIGDDVIVQKFFSPVYVVDGITDALVEIATSVLPGGPAGTYQTTNLSIGANQIAIFDSIRVTIQ